MVESDKEGSPNRFCLRHTAIAFEDSCSAHDSRIVPNGFPISTNQNTSPEKFGPKTKAKQTKSFPRGQKKDPTDLAMDLAFVLPSHGATVPVTAPTTAARASVPAVPGSATASAQQGVAALGVAAVAGAAMRRGRRSVKVPQAGSPEQLEGFIFRWCFQICCFFVHLSF